MIDDEAFNDLLIRACLVFGARATHAGGDAGTYTTVYINRLADDLLATLDTCELSERPYLMEGYRSLSLAADIPAGRSCRQREMLVDVARQGLAYVVAGRLGGQPATRAEALALLDSRWTASLLAWAEFFPPALDDASPPCGCGAFGLACTKCGLPRRLPSVLADTGTTRA
ncbi:hypothetical protein ACFVV7_34025 [Streptomyces globisporus]|uniref:hypothetical protein n=1 Tax=Streptomyces globisporus TaxID=1908 RepID=UPI0036DD731E